MIEFFDEEEIDEVDELREILNHYHLRTLLQVIDYWTIQVNANTHLPKAMF